MRGRTRRRGYPLRPGDAHAGTATGRRGSCRLAATLSPKAPTLQISTRISSMPFFDRRTELFLVSSILITACSATDDVGGGALASGCEELIDCESGLVCALGQCRVPCSNDQACGADERCIQAEFEQA